MAKLVCQTGPKAGHEYPLNKDVITMGRQSSCDVQILDNMSSRAHCQIRRDGKLYSLVDLGSRNGTHLNDKKVSERQLVFGDRIRIGEAEYKLVKESGDVELKDLLSKYDVMEKIGEGGMGIVYKANQRSMNRIVALKILSPKYSMKQRFVDQFIKEARAAGALNHPNIIQVHDVGTENDIHYFSMEFVEGPTCMQVLRSQGTIKVPEALEITRQTAKALDYAHSQRLIHQDIKPDNIMIGLNNQVKLADLGISKTFDEVESEEDSKRVMGTPHYMAPEAAMGKKIDHRVDIYSLGATLYHLLTGKTPYTGTSATEVLKAHVMDPLPAIQDLNPEVPDDVCALVERLVAKKPDARYQTAAEVLAEITRLQQGLGLGTERIGGGETMMLRRYVSGDKISGDKSGDKNGDKSGGEKNQQTPAHTTNTRTPRTTDGGATTDERTILGNQGNTILVKGAILFTIALILFLIGWNVFSSTRINANIPTQPNSITPEPTTTTTLPSPQTDTSDRPHAVALTNLEDRLRSNGELLDLNALRAQVEELGTQRLSPDNRGRQKQLLDRIRLLLEQRHVKAVEQDFSTLRTEVQKLVNEYNFELAIQRLKAFPTKEEPTIATKLQALNDDVARAKSSYLKTLSLKIQSANNQKNIAKLKELRDQLPAPMLGTDIEAEITNAITALDNEQQAALQTIVHQAANELAHWNFSGLETLNEKSRASLGTTEKGKLFDTYLQAAQQLSALVKAIDSQLKAATRYPRYRGVLRGWNDPDIISADLTGLQLEVANGGTVGIKWTEIPSDTLTTIVKLILQKDAPIYQPAIDVLATAQLIVTPK